MTMATLLGNPDRSANPLTSTTLPTSCGLLPDPITSTQTQQHPDTHILYCNAGLRDIPTDVPTTAATPDADDDDDDDRYRHHSSIATDDNFAITPDFLRQWEAFYNDFLHLAQSLGVSYPSTDESQHVSMPAVSPADDEPETTPVVLATLDDLSNELLHPLQSPSASPATTNDNQAASMNATIVRHNDCAAAERDNNEHDDNNRSTDLDTDDRSHDERANARDSETSNNNRSTNDDRDNPDNNDPDRGYTNHDTAERRINDHDHDARNTEGRNPAAFENTGGGEDNRRHNNHHEDGRRHADRNKADRHNDTSDKNERDKDESRNHDRVNSPAPDVTHEPSRKWNHDHDNTNRRNAARDIDGCNTTCNQRDCTNNENDNKNSFRNKPADDRSTADDDKASPKAVDSGKDACANNHRDTAACKNSPNNDNQSHRARATSDRTTDKHNNSQRHNYARDNNDPENLPFADWETFYRSHLQFLETMKLDPLPWTSPVPNDDCPYESQDHITVTQLHQQQSHIPIQPPPSLHYATPPVNSGPLPPQILKQNTNVSHVSGSKTTSIAPPTTTESRTQTMQKIVALLDELQELTLQLLQLFSSHALRIVLPRSIPLIHLTQHAPPPTVSVHQVMQKSPVPSLTTCPSYTTPKHCTHYHAHLKHVRFKTHARSSCIKLLSWPNDMFPP